MISLEIFERVMCTLTSKRKALYEVLWIKGIMSTMSSITNMIKELRRDKTKNVNEVSKM